MEGKEESKVVCNGGEVEDKRYVFFSHSDSSVIAFDHNPEMQQKNSDDDKLKLMGVNALEKARADRENSSLVVEMINGETHESSEISVISDEDSDVKSDAASSRDAPVVEEELDDDNEGIDDILYDEAVKKKLEFLAGMVGINFNEPGVVLAQVLRILKDLERQKLSQRSGDN